MNRPNAKVWTDLEAELRADKPRFAASPALTDRVMANLPPRMDPAKSRRRSSRWPLLFIPLATTACIALALLQMQIQPRQGPVSENISAKAEPAPLPETVRWPAISATQVEAWTARLDEPLQRELDNVISDTRQAIQFIASNFLPEN